MDDCRVNVAGFRFEGILMLPATWLLDTSCQSLAPTVMHPPPGSFVSIAEGDRRVRESNAKGVHFVTR